MTKKRDDETPAFPEPPNSLTTEGSVPSSGWRISVMAGSSGGPHAVAQGTQHSILSLPIHLQDTMLPLQDTPRELAVLGNSHLLSLPPPSLPLSFPLHLPKHQALRISGFQIPKDRKFR